MSYLCTGPEMHRPGNIAPKTQDLSASGGRIHLPGHTSDGNIVSDFTCTSLFPPPTVRHVH